MPTTSDPSTTDPSITGPAQARARAAAALPSLVDDVVALTAIPAPTGEEQGRVEWLQEKLRDLPGDCRRDPAGNLIWTFGGGAPDLLVLAHLDSVFSKDTDLRVRRSDGYLEGAGVGDNVCAVVVCASVIGGLVADHGPQPLAVAFTVCEEGLGNLRGALAACEQLEPQRVVAVEGHGLGEVVVDAVGSVRARIVVEGPGGHSWWDRGRPSALHAMIRILHLLLTENPGVNVNVGTIEGGSSVNAIAHQCSALVEGRALDGSALRAFEVRLDAISVGSPLRSSVELLGRRPAGPLDPGGDLVALARRARRMLTLPDGLGDGSTDANAALARGIPAVGLGCAYGSGMHSVQERIEVSSIELGHAQLRLVLELAMGLG